MYGAAIKRGRSRTGEDRRGGTTPELLGSDGISMRSDAMRAQCGRKIDGLCQSKKGRAVAQQEQQSEKQEQTGPNAAAVTDAFEEQTEEEEKREREEEEEEEKEEEEKQRGAAQG